MQQTQTGNATVSDLDRVRDGTFARLGECPNG